MSAPVSHLIYTHFIDRETHLPEWAHLWFLKWLLFKVGFIHKITNRLIIESNEKRVDFNASNEKWVRFFLLFFTTLLFWFAQATRRMYSNRKKHLNWQNTNKCGCKTERTKKIILCSSFDFIAQIGEIIEMVQGYTNVIPHIAKLLERKQRILLLVILTKGWIYIYIWVRMFAGAVAILPMHSVICICISMKHPQLRLHRLYLKP